MRNKGIQKTVKKKVDKKIVIEETTGTEKKHRLLKNYRRNYKEKRERKVNIEMQKINSGAKQ